MSRTNQNFIRASHPKGKIAMLAVLSLALLLLFRVAVAGSAAQAAKKPLFPNGPTFSPSDRILVVSPHPDDETLGVGGAIRRAVEMKIPILVVFLTTGDGYRKAARLALRVFNPGPQQFRELAVIRHEESLRAMKELGVGEKQVVFFAYPDGGTNSIFDLNWDYNNLHQGLNGATRAPYPFAYEKNAPYAGANVVKNLEEVMRSFKPSIIFYPDSGDDNHDHWATGAFVEYAMTEMNYQGKQFTYLVHKGFHWPSPSAYRPERQLLPPSQLRGLGATWMRFFLTKAEEARKHQAVNLYASQIAVREPFLEAFVRRNELFAVYPDIKVAPVKKRPDFFSGSRLPHAVFRDASREKSIRDLEGSADLTAVGFAFNQKNAWLALETRRGIARGLTYGFHLRIFERNGVRRLDISVQHGKASSEILAKNSLKVRTLRAEIRNNRLVVEIPGKFFRNAQRLLMGVDILNGSDQEVRVDRTAYRRIDF